MIFICVPFPCCFLHRPFLGDRCQFNIHYPAMPSKLPRYSIVQAGKIGLPPWSTICSLPVFNLGVLSLPQELIHPSDAPLPSPPIIKAIKGSFLSFYVALAITCLMIIIRAYYVLGNVLYRNYLTSQNSFLLMVILLCPFSGEVMGIQICDNGMNK